MDNRGVDKIETNDIKFYSQRWSDLSVKSDVQDSLSTENDLHPIALDQR